MSGVLAVEYLQNIKDKYSGQICVIICNGPSLRVTDLDKLQNNNIVTFGTNRIYNIFPKTVWGPTYYVCEVELIIREKLEEIRAISALAKYIPIELKWYHEVSVPGATYFHMNYNSKTENEWSFLSNIAK